MSSKQHDFSAYTSLVILCCHATFVGENLSSIYTESEWILQPFQLANRAAGKPSEIFTLISHIMAGAVLCRADPAALLMFSGGKTTNSTRSEAQSYRQVFEGLQAGGQVLPAVCAIEEHATDSYQNLLFSIIRFRELVGQYPERVTVITHAFKERRFLKLHAPMIGWPGDRIRVQGINPPFTLEEVMGTANREYENAYQPFEEDPYGARAPLAEKRAKRNWDPAVTAKWTVEEEVRRLLAWTGGESGKQVFPGKLPWQKR